VNKRIRELVRQAVIAVDDPFPGNPLNDELEKMYIPDCFSEKFAELIVRECLSKIENEAAQYSEPTWAVELVNDIKDHFGVEE
jgi:hypothetical protein